MLKNVVWLSLVALLLSTSLKSQTTVIWSEDFEEAASEVYTSSESSIPVLSHNWSYEKTQAGRLRLAAGSGFYYNGNNAATLDAEGGLTSINYLTTSVDISGYSSNLSLSFAFMHHGEERHSNERVWLRSSDDDSQPWVEVYNLYDNRGTAGVWNLVSEIDVSAVLSSQPASNYLQIRFGQEDNWAATNTGRDDGITFDDIKLIYTPPPVSGDYRTTRNSDWTTNGRWEVYNGSSWAITNSDPGENGNAGTVTIRAGHTITVDVDRPNPSYSIEHLVVDGTLQYSWTGATGISIDGTVTGIGTVDMTRNGLAHTLTVGGDFNPTSFSAGSANLILNGSGSQNIGAFTYNNLTVINTGVKALAGDVTVNGSFSVTAGAVAIGDNILTLNGPVAACGGITGGIASDLVIGGTDVNAALPGGTYHNLSLNRANGATLCGPVVVNGTLTLSNGNLTLENYDLTLGKTADIAGAPFSGANMVETNGTGQFIKQSDHTAGFNMTYPIGTGTNYNGMVVSSLTAVVNPSASIAVRAVEGRAANTSGNDLDKHWVVESINVSNVTVDLSFAYDEPGDVNGNPASYSFRYSATNPASTWVEPANASEAGVNPLVTTGSTALDGVWTARETSLTYYSLRSGDWNDPTIWTLDPAGVLVNNPSGRYPQAGDENAVVKNGKEVVMNIDGASCNVLTVEGTLDLGTTTGHNIAKIRGNGRIKMASDNWPSADASHFVSIGQGTAVYYGDSYTLGTSRTFHNMEVQTTAGRTLTMLADYTLQGNLEVKSGTFRINDNNASVVRTLTVQGNVTIDNGASMTVGTENVGRSNGNYHKLYIGGDFLNNGTAKFTNLTDYRYGNWDNSGAVEVIFNSATKNQALECNGTTIFNMLTCDKGSDATYILAVSATDSEFFKLYGCIDQPNTGDNEVGGDRDGKRALRLLAGTLRLGSNIVIPRLTQSYSYDIDTDCRLWIADGANVTTSRSGDGYLAVYGTIHISGVASTFVNNTNAGVLLRNHGIFKIEEGTATLDNLRTSSWGAAGDHTGAYIQTGGIVTINGEAVENEYAPFHLPYETNTFQMTGGVLNIRSVESSWGGYARYFAMVANCSASNSNVTGGEVIIDMNENSNAYMTSRVPFYNLRIRNSNGTPRTLSIRAFNDLRNNIDDTPALPVVVLNDFTLEGGADSPTFNAMGQNVSIGGHFVVEANSRYISGDNTTIFNGSTNSSITNANATSIAFNNLSIEKEIHSTSGSFYQVEVNEASAGVFSVAGDLTISRGALNTTTFSPTIAGNIEIVDGVITNTTGQLELNGSSASQTLKGATGMEQEFGSIFLNNGNQGLSLLSDVNLTNLNFATTGSAKVNMGSYNLTISGTITNANAGGRWVYSAGSASNGGLSIFIGADGEVAFPVGMASKYTPARINVSGVSDDGYVTCVPVNSVLQTTNPAGDAIMPYYWKMKHRGFTALPNVTYTFNYEEANNLAYYPGKVLDETPYTRSYVNDVNKVVEASKSILFDVPFPLENANYTAGADTRFTGAVEVFYSRDLTQQANWRENNAWTLAPVDLDGNGTVDDYEKHDSRQSGAGSNYPQVGDVAVIGWIPWTDKNRDGIPNNGSGDSSDNSDLRGQPHGIWADNRTETCAEVVFTPMADASGQPVTRYYRSNFQFRPTLCINGSGQVAAGMVRGEGMFWNRSSDPDFSLMDIGEFAAQDSSYIVYEFFANNTTLNNTPDLAPNLMVSANDWGNNNYNVIFSKSIETTGNFEMFGDVNVMLPTGAAGDITVGRDLLMFEGSRGGISGGGAWLAFANNGANRNVRILRDLIMNNSGALISVNGADGSPLDHQLYIGRHILQKTTSGGGLKLWTANNQDRINLTLNGEDAMVYTHTSGAVPELYKLTVEKGSSITTSARFDGDFNLNGPSNGTDKALIINNGLFIVNNTLINLPLTSGSSNFSLPATGGLEVKAGTVTAKGGSGINLSGLLKISGGTLDMTGGDNPIVASASGTGQMVVSAGTVNVGGQIRRSESSEVGAMSYIQSGGTMVAGYSAASMPSRGVFEVMGTGSRLEITGGDLYIARSSSISVPALYLLPETTLLDANNTIHIGHSTTTGETIGIYSTQVLSNLEVVNGNVAKQLTIPLSINGNLSIVGAGSEFNANGLDLNIGGDLTNDGIFTHGDNTTTFNGINEQTITGALGFYNFSKTGANTVTLATAPNASVNVTNDLIINSGVLADGGNSITVQGDVEMGGTHQYGGAGSGIVLNGALSQNVAGNGTFGMLTINNSNGVSVPIGSSLSIIDKLRLVAGVFNIDKNLLTLGENCTIEEGLPFSSSNMIQTNASFTDAGIKKMLGSGAQNVIFPIGSGGRYTPVNLDFSDVTSTSGSIGVKAASEYHPSVIDATNVLQYYWVMNATQLSNCVGSATMVYDELDVALNGHVESEYVAARLLSDGSGNWNKFDEASVDESANSMTFTFGGVGDNEISGDYTAGVKTAIPDKVPSYISVANGAWTSRSTWATFDPSTGAIGTPSDGVPVNGPRGALVYVDTEVAASGDDIKSYLTTINTSGSLNMGSTRYHRLGVVKGQGTLATSLGDLPAGDYASFISEVGGTLEYNGAGNISVLTDMPVINHLKLSGTGTRTLPNIDIQLLGSLTIDGPLVDNNTYDRSISVKGNVLFESGAFTSGNLAGAKFVMNGSSLQTIGGASDFTSSSRDLFHFEINNTAGVELNRPVDVAGNLILTSGMLKTSSANILQLISASGVSIGGKGSSFVEGPMKKQITSGSAFEFPVGKSNRYGAIVVNGVSKSGLWQAEYFNDSPGNAGYDPFSMMDPVAHVSQNEYWNVFAPSAATAGLTLRWDANSGVNPAEFNLRAVQWMNGAWNEVALGTKYGNISGGTVAISAPIAFNKNASGNYVAFGSVSIPAYSWIGVSSTDWFDATNWSNAIVPSASSDVTINNVSNKPVINKTAQAHANNLTISPLSSLTLLPGAHMTLRGNLITNGGFIIENTNAEPASFINHGSITGDVTIQWTYDARRYWYIGHGTKEFQLSSWGKMTDPPNVYVYDFNRNWSSGLADQKVTQPLKGYSAIFRNTTPVSYTGELNTTDLQMTLIDGWQLVANPYASYYQLQKQEMSNTDFEHTTGSVYVRTGADQNSRSLATYNTLSGIATPADYKGIIAPMQAFWVRRETPGNIVMKQANRIHDGARSALKSASVGELDLLRLQLTNGRSNDEAVVAFRENGSLMLSRFDSEKRFDKEDQVTPYIYTMKEKQATVINMMPQVMSKQTVMLGLRIPDIDEEQLRLTVVGMETLNENVAVYLEDKATGAMIDLRSQSIYDFSAKAATINDRLVLHFNEAISTDIENPQADESVSVYAYQNGGELMVFENLLADRPNGKVRIELFSITGSKVVERTFNASGLHALPANLASGTYLVKVFAHENEPYVVKVVIR